MLIVRLFPIWGFFVLGLLLFRGLTTRSLIRKDWSISWALSTLLTGAAAILIAEVAGAFNQLTLGCVAGAWLGLDILLAVLIVRFFKAAPGTLLASFRSQCQLWWAALRSRPPVTTALFAGAILMIAFAGFLALTCPTTIWDCETYHMPRVVHWLQEANVRHFPTNNARQDELAPGSELICANLMLLAGSDLPVNLPSWWALLTASWMAAFLAKELLSLSVYKKKPWDTKLVDLGAVFAAILVMTIPDSIAQSITTENDLVTAMWVIIAVSMMMLFVQTPKNLAYMLGVGAALALGIVTKSTTFLYTAPFLGLLTLYFLFKKTPAPVVKLALVSLALVAALNLPWMVRNYRTFDSPLASKNVYDITRAKHVTPSKVVCNILRNLSLYTRSVSGPLTDSFNSTIVGLNKLTGEDFEDPDFVYQHSNFYLQPKLSIGDGGGFASCCFVLLAFAGIGAFVIKFPFKSFMSLYLLAVAGGFIFFCAYLKWQPWHQRLHLTFFILAAPFIGAALGVLINRYVMLILSALIFANAFFVMYFNLTYPIQSSEFRQLPREEQYFAARPQLHGLTAELAHDIIQSGATNVLLKTGGDSWEYPLWVCLKNRGFHGTLQHILVENETAATGPTNFPTAGSVIVAMDANLASPPPEFPLNISYSMWNAYFNGNTPEHRVKLIGNQLQMGLNIPAVGQLRVRCHPVDAQGRAATNTVLRLTAPNFSQDFPVSSEVVDLICPVPQGQVPVSISCPGTEDQHMALSNLELNFDPK